MIFILWWIQFSKLGKHGVLHTLSTENIYIISIRLPSTCIIVNKDNVYYPYFKAYSSLKTLIIFVSNHHDYKKMGYTLIGIYWHSEFCDGYVSISARILPDWKVEWVVDKDMTNLRVLVDNNKVCFRKDYQAFLACYVYYL